MNGSDSQAPETATISRTSPTPDAEVLLANEPVDPWQRFKPWAKVSPQEWNDWKWQVKNLVTKPEQLVEIFPTMAGEVAGIAATLVKYKFAVTPYYTSLIDPDNPECPIKLQAIPAAEEMQVLSGVDLRDPLAEDRDMPVPGLVHRYPDRVLFLITEVCTVYCRFCTRRRVILERDSHIDRQIEMGLDYIRKHQEVRDVIISGGDALHIGETLLEHVMSEVRAIPHVDIMRLGSRIPVVCPMRITPSLVSMIKKYQPVYFMTHFNHPYEITQAAKKACALLVDHGIPVFNQAVLLRKINSCPVIIKNLCHELVKMRVHPYYLYQCDLSEGIGHFRTPVGKGLEIMEYLRGHTSGLALPTFMIDAPGGGGKIPVMPNYLLTLTNDKVLLRNYAGKMYVYTQNSEQDCSCSTSEEIRKRMHAVSSTGTARLISR